MRKIVKILSITLLLTACGGGGSGSSKKSPNGPDRSIPPLNGEVEIPVQEAIKEISQKI